MKFLFSSKADWKSFYFTALKKPKAFNFTIFIKHPLLIFVWYFAWLLPFCCLLLFFCIEKEKLAEKEMVIDTIEGKIVRLIENQKEKQYFINKYKDFDPNYIENTLETLSFLNQEVEVLKEAHDHKDLKGAGGVKKRLDHLLSPNNQLVFIKQPLQETPVLEESFLRQSSKVELNTGDLKNLLTLVEDLGTDNTLLQTQKPQLVVQSFHLNREELFEKESCFLEMNLICRKPKNQS